jgi:hypothetical protein
MMSAQLPDQFAVLEPFVSRFAVAGTAARAALRSEASRAEREAFHAVAKDRIVPALDLLDQRPLASLSEAEQNLLNLTLSFAHIALAVEVQGPDEERHAAMRQHMRIVRSTADC